MTQVFEHPGNIDGSFECPICGTDADIPVVLVPIRGTEINDRQQAQQIHAACMIDAGDQAITAFPINPTGEHHAKNKRD